MRKLLAEAVVKMQPKAQTFKRAHKEKRLMLEDKARRAKSIRQWGYFQEYNTPSSGWTRFWSGDARFPISIAFPGPGAYLVRDDPSHLILDTESGFTVNRRYPVREDTISFMKNWAENWLDTRRKLADGARWAGEDPGKYKGDYKYRIVDSGSGLSTLGAQEYASKARRIVFTRRVSLLGRGTGEVVGEWVFFARRGIDEVWAIIRNVKEIDEDDFKVALSSFRWLNDDYFRSLPS